MECPKCKAKIQDNSAFCPKCGHRISNKSMGSKPTKHVSSQMIIGVFILFILGGIGYGYFYTTPKAKYNRANNAYEKGNYQVASRLYNDLGDYLDAKEKYNNSEKHYHYNNALELLKNNKYSEAIEEFNKTDNLDDSKEKINECYYNHAVDLIESNPEEAINEFMKSHFYNDSTDKIYEIAKGFLLNQKYKEAFDAFSAIGKLGDPYGAYSEGMNALKLNSYENAANCFKKAGDILDSKEKYQESLYRYAKELYERKNYSLSAQKFNEISEYKDSQQLVKVCNLGNAYYMYEQGKLNGASDALDKIPDGTSYGNMSKKDLKAKLDNVSLWKDICGKWITTGGEMRVTQQGSYGYSYWWYRDFVEGEQTIDVTCVPNDDGTVTIKTSGQIPIYTSYSSVAIGVNSGYASLNGQQKFTSPGCLNISDTTSVTIGKNGIKAVYNRKDNSQDVYFTYIYKTTMNFNKRTISY